jgi:hypothetical protein
LLLFFDLNQLSVKHLKAFIVARQSADPLVPPKGAKKKGTIQEASNGEPTYLTLAKMLLEKPIIAQAPIFVPPAIPAPMEVPQTIIRHHGALTIESWRPTAAWCREAAACIHPIEENCRIGYWIQHMDELDETSTLLAQKIHSRLPQFLRNRLKATLQTHWVWDSFVELFLKRISCLVVLCNQHSQCIQTTSTRDSLLNCNLEMFPIIQGEFEVLDGCYVASDSKRGWLIRAGMAERTFSKRWKEHVAASMRASVDTMYRNLYWFYPHKNVMQTVPGRKGVFQDLQQRMGLGMTRGDRNKVLNLFNWSEQLESRLSKLSYGQDRAALLDWKKYRNVCYMFELFFAVAMKESDNITQNPTCEWQLQLYSKNG